MGLLFREHPKAQPEGGFRRSPGSNLRPLVYKVSDLTTAPRRLLDIFMPTDPQHLKYKTDNDLKTAIISTILGQLAFFSFLLVLNFIACLFRVRMINFSTFLLFIPIFKKENIPEKTLPRLRHVSGNFAIFIL